LYPSIADELIDICDENNNIIAQKMKIEAHRDGLWHRAAHIWLYNLKGQILLQLRAKTKLIFPAMWDFSVAGHVLAGEDPVTSGLREGMEEIGLKIDRSDLEFFKVLKKGCVYNGIRNNEFYYIYLARFDRDISVLKIQKEELDAVRFFSVEEIEEGLRTEPERFVPHGRYWTEVLEQVRKRTGK
jgi:isopentenyldiphosphate isomerase